ncbi:hypothetical protein PtA15_17A397 [Puccinia triticina]|uniref:Uncharacterized protein n=1 Tax=Puccinia triticina TaxID=208348 RepID=A0ABY7DA71_9BASI|nr:uncharacterized protein PtA15_17A397 [Puccinia triticina]WAQ92915.1 hypothetical protein PtA15_17A397 [Puccinia triticina]
MKLRLATLLVSLVLAGSPLAKPLFLHSDAAAPQEAAARTYADYPQMYESAREQYPPKSIADVQHPSLLRDSLSTKTNGLEPKEESTELVFLEGLDDPAAPGLGHMTLKICWGDLIPEPKDLKKLYQTFVYKDGAQNEHHLFKAVVFHSRDRKLAALHIQSLSDRPIRFKLWLPRRRPKTHPDWDVPVHADAGIYKPTYTEETILLPKTKRTISIEPDLRWPHRNGPTIFVMGCLEPGEWDQFVEQLYFNKLAELQRQLQAAGPVRLSLPGVAPESGRVVSPSQSIQELRSGPVSPASSDSSLSWLDLKYGEENGFYPSRFAPETGNGRSPNRPAPIARPKPAKLIPQSDRVVSQFQSSRESHSGPVSPESPESPSWLGHEYGEDLGMYPSLFVPPKGNGHIQNQLGPIRRPRFTEEEINY